LTTRDQKIWKLPGTFSDAHIERLRRVHGRVLPAGGVMTASLLYSTEFANDWYAAAAIILTVALFAGAAALQLWPHHTLRTLRVTVGALLVGLNAGVFGSYQEAIHSGIARHLQLSGSLYGVSIVIMIVHMLFTPLGARFVGLGVWLGTTFVALTGLLLYWDAGGSMQEAILETMRFVLSGGVTLGFMEIFSQLSGVQLRAEVQNSLLEYRANTDVLTELPNRRAFQAQSQQEFDARQRLQSPMSLIAIDIDCFKSINDLYGHDAGDRVLQQVAGVIRLLSEPPHYPMRWGGDEFAVLLPGCDLEQAQALAERLRSGIEALREETNGATVSIGIALYREGDSPDTLLKRADQGLYRAKDLGRNRVEASPQHAYPALPIDDNREICQIASNPRP
jgi:diguanylate cyclase (GGDEF)-like protein